MTGPLSVGCSYVALLTAVTLLAQEPTFKVDVRLVRLVATVKNTAGHPVGGLNKDDFTVFDNGVKQTISLFERHTAQPLSVALLVDTSGSTNKEMKYQTESVQRFLQAFFKEGNPDDAAALFTFNWQVQEVVPFSRRLRRFEPELRKLRGEAGTSLYDGIYLTAERISDREGRRVIIVVTDGADTVSAKNYHDALRAAHEADTVIYGILAMPILNDAGRQIGGEHALFGISQSTGGKMFTPTFKGIDLAFEEILRDLRTQYLIGFYPKDVPLTKEPFHKIEIRTMRPELRVVSRTGYYGDALASRR